MAEKALGKESVKLTKEISLLILKEAGKDVSSTVKAAEVKEKMSQISFDRQESILEKILSDYQEIVQEEEGEEEEERGEGEEEN